ncbi:MAG: 4-hydroxy-tetrahydrodipicolinate reductase [Microbacteriaceae bacterium]|nr:4-hydroxy-tetrahydrodipicolinate reductase [Microbacteriaceae bacterium]
MAIKVSVVGATGRMGQLALGLIDSAQDLELHSAIDSKTDLALAKGADVIFEATRLEVSQQVVAFALENSINIVVATSGWRNADLEKLPAKESALVVIPNFSIGSVLGSRFAAEAAKYFDSVEIVETHHAGKVDSPSGTAIRTAELIQSQRQAEPKIQGLGQEARGQVVAGVPIHSLRIEGAAAKQEVILGGNQETLVISHQANSVQAYSQGILESLRYAVSVKGLVIGLDKVLGI